MKPRVNCLVRIIGATGHNFDVAKTLSPERRKSDDAAVARALKAAGLEIGEVAGVLEVDDNHLGNLWVTVQKAGALSSAPTVDLPADCVQVMLAEGEYVRVTSTGLGSNRVHLKPAAQQVMEARLQDDFVEAEISVGDVVKIEKVYSSLNALLVSKGGHSVTASYSNFEFP